MGRYVVATVLMWTCKNRPPNSTFFQHLTPRYTVQPAELITYRALLPSFMSKGHYCCSKFHKELMKTGLTAFHMIFYKLLRRQDAFYCHILLHSVVLMCLRMPLSISLIWLFFIFIPSWGVSILFSVILRMQNKFYSHFPGHNSQNLLHLINCGKERMVP